MQDALLSASILPLTARDIRRAADFLLDRYGDAAPARAQRRVRCLLEDEQLDAARIWARIAEAVARPEERAA